MSGIDVADELLALYNEVKLRKTYKYFVFELVATGTVAGRTSYAWSILNKAGPGATNAEAWNEMTSAFPADSARFAVFDFEEVKADGRAIQKLVLIKWCPDAVHFRMKMVAGSSYQTLKDKLLGLAKDIQAADASDLLYDTVKASL